MDNLPPKSSHIGGQLPTQHQPYWWTTSHPSPAILVDNLPPKSCHIGGQLPTQHQPYWWTTSHTSPAILVDNLPPKSCHIGGQPPTQVLPYWWTTSHTSPAILVDNLPPAPCHSASSLCAHKSRPVPLGSQNVCQPSARRVTLERTTLPPHHHPHQFNKGHNMVANMAAHSAALRTNNHPISFTVQLSSLLWMVWALLWLVPHLSNRHGGVSVHAFGGCMSLGRRRPHLYTVHKMRHTVLKQLSQYSPTHCRHLSVAGLIPHSSHLSCSAEDATIQQVNVHIP